MAKTSTSNKHNTSWFNDDCRKAIRLRKSAFRKFNKQPTTTNLNDFKILRAKTRKHIKEAKKKSWQNYVNQLGSSTKTNINLEDDYENLRKTPTNHSQTPHKKQRA